MISAKLPYSFVTGISALTWKDIQFGLTHGYIGPEVAIEHAATRIGEVSKPDADEIAISLAAKDEPILERVNKLAQQDATDEALTRRKWLCLIMTWLYENRLGFYDALAVVEQIYADFGYPEEMASVVRYMPDEGSDLGSGEQNEAKLFKRWGEFVTKCREKVGVINSRL